MATAGLMNTKFTLEEVEVVALGIHVNVASLFNMPGWQHYVCRVANI